jgi:hypothetical protein
VWRSLFPNDLAIAITAKRSKFKRKGSPEGDNDGCDLYSLHHSEPIFKTMVDAYHQFISVKDETNAINGASGRADEQLPAQAQSQIQSVTSSRG